MAFSEIALKEDIPAGTMKPFTFNGKEILVINLEDTYYAIDRKCTHLGGDLFKGKLEGKTITCPRHGSQFDVTTGDNLRGPKIGFLKLKTVDLPVYEVVVEGSSIKIRED